MTTKVQEDKKQSSVTAIQKSATSQSVQRAEMQAGIQHLEQDVGTLMQTVQASSAPVMQRQDAAMALQDTIGNFATTRLLNQPAAAPVQQKADTAQSMPVVQFKQEEQEKSPAGFTSSQYNTQIIQQKEAEEIDDSKTDLVQQKSTEEVISESEVVSVQADTDTVVAPVQQLAITTQQQPEVQFKLEEQEEEQEESVGSSSGGLQMLKATHQGAAAEETNNDTNNLPQQESIQQSPVQLASHSIQTHAEVAVAPLVQEPAGITQLSPVTQLDEQKEQESASADSGKEQQKTQAVHAAAAEGISGGSTTLPHQETIQQSFGHHDISGIQAHTDSAAQSATAAIGAKAYTTGSHVALGSQGSDLHTVAHEAAHVIQQRGGVQLAGGLGQPNDEHEQHADSVADLVVKGASAEPLLDRYSAANNNAHAMQAAPLLKSGRPVALQADFIGYTGGFGWNLDNTAVPATLNNYAGCNPGAANLAGGGEEAGADGAREIDMDALTAYAKPGRLGGFVNFGKTGGQSALRDPSTKAKFKAYTHLHVLNGIMHGPGTPDNLVLGGTPDNNRHLKNVEQHIETSVAGAGQGKAKAYEAAMAKNTANGTDPFELGGLDSNVYWDNPNEANIPGVKAYAARKVVTPAAAAVVKNATHYVDTADAVHTQKDYDANNPGRWFHYKVEPLYNLAATPPTVAQNIADAINVLQTAVAGFTTWVRKSFPETLRCDADEYRPSYDPAKIWRKRSEAQEDVDINR